VPTREADATTTTDLRARAAPFGWAALYALTLTLGHIAPGAVAVAPLGVLGLCGASLGRTSPRWSALAVFACALPAYALLQRWMIHITLPGYLGLVVAMSAVLAFAAWLSARAARRTRRVVLACLATGAIYAAVEFARGRVLFSGYPWYTLGQPAVDLWGAPTLASFVGMHGVHAILLFACAAVAGVTLGARSSARRLGAPGCAVVALALAHVARPAPAPPEDGLLVAVVQTNVPQSNKQSSSVEDKIAQFRDAALLTGEAATLARREFGRAPDVIVWPETMFPAPALNTDAVEALRDAPADSFALAPDMRDALLTLQGRVGAPMLVGAMALDNPRVVPAEEEGYVRLVHDGSFNSVFLVAEGAVRDERYDKMHLTPFGEVMPGISRSDWLEAKLLALGAPGMSFDLEAGDRPVRFEVAGAQVATPICFEATMPHVCRRLAFEGGRRRAGVLINATNDGWFGATDQGRRDHLRLARWRAAELATPVVRAANTGVSCFIDARGRVYDAGPTRAPGALAAFVRPGEGATLYARTGDALGWAVLGAGIALGAWALWPVKNRPNRRRPPNAETSRPSPD
jgi:apolipoprotein N-acyltransferase